MREGRARLDGASELQLFYRIAVPLATPAFSTLGILTMLFCWNDIIWPLIVIFADDVFVNLITVLPSNVVVAESVTLEET